MANTYVSKINGHIVKDTEAREQLAGKAASSHTHTIANVDGLQSALDGKADQSDYNQLYDTITNINTELGKKANDADLKTVAKTGSYNDLTNKPTIPAAVTVDSALSSTSTNPVQNKVINSALDSKVTLSTAQEITGKKTLTNNFLVKVSTNDVLAPSGDWGWASPISKYLWHDLLAFRDAKAEYSTDGVTWIEDASDSYKRNLTNQKENQTITVINDSRKHSRFTWDAGSAIWHACQAAWLIIGFTYVNPAATCTIKFQSSTDGSTFTDVFTKSMSGNQAPYWLKLNESLWTQCRAVRLTMSRTSTSGSIALSSVRWLTKRWGNQGFGSELETPFDWNNDASIIRRKSSSTLGTSSIPWAAVYGNTLYENGVALSSKYATITQLGNKADQTDVDQLSEMVSLNLDAAKEYTDEKVAGIVGSAPETLDTLNELAAALNRDENFATTVSTQIGQKASQADLDSLSRDVDLLETEVGKKANDADLKAVAKSGSYNDLTNKPTIPTVNNATLTIQKNGSNVATFTANSASNATANITVPTKTSELTNDSNFATTAQLDNKADITDYDQLLAMYNDIYTELENKANDADLKAVAKSGSYNDLTNKPTIPTVNNGTLTIQKNGTNVATFTANQSGNVTANITVPTSINDLGSGYLNTHPENSSTIIPFIHNDLAFLSYKGGSYSVYSTTSTDFTVADLTKNSITIANPDNMFDGSPSYGYIQTNVETLAVIDMSLHKLFTYSNQFYIDFGSVSWRAKNIAVYAMNSDNETKYTLKNSTTSNSKGNWYCSIAHSSKNSAGTTDPGFNKLRVVLSSWNDPSDSSHKRIAQIGLINFTSTGVKETYVSRGGSSMYGNLIPYNNYGANLGGLNNQWNAIYGGTIYENGTALSSKYATLTVVNSRLPLTGGDMTGVINYAGKTQQVLAFAPNDATWRGGLKYSWSSNTTIGLWGKHPMSQFVWHAGTDFVSTDVNGTSIKTYDFQIGRDVATGTPIVRTSGNFSEGGVLLSDKYVTNTKLEEVLGSYVNDIDALLGG